MSASRSAGLVPARLDPGDERELVEQLGHLHRRRLDHLDVAVGGRLELERDASRVFAKPCTVASGVRTSWQPSETSRAKEVSFFTDRAATVQG